MSGGYRHKCQKSLLYLGIQSIGILALKRQFLKKKMCIPLAAHQVRTVGVFQTMSFKALNWDTFLILKKKKRYFRLYKPLTVRYKHTATETTAKKANRALLRLTCPGPAGRGVAPIDLRLDCLIYAAYRADRARRRPSNQCECASLGPAEAAETAEHRKGIP